MTDLNQLFKPSNIAVIGASTNPKKVGYAVLKNILDSGFEGELIPVNPRAETILNLECYESILNIPNTVDLAVVTVPAASVPRVLEECGRKNVKGVIVISAGFKELGPEGAVREKEILEICSRNNIRMLGPNCLGLISTNTPLNASFASKMPLKGAITFVSQSGALCTAILGWSIEEKIGFSNIVSLGNKADLDEADFLQALVEDKHTKVLIAYIEGVRDGKKFLEVVRSITKKKPVIMLKSGVTEAGGKAASSHTGSITGSDVAYETAFRQIGIIRANTTEELFDLARAFQAQPIPSGRNVAIITNAGGPGILAADSCERYGLHMASLTRKTMEELRKKLPPAANFHNPVDILGDADATRYSFALSQALGDPNVDAAVVILTPQAMTQPKLTAEVLLDANTKKPTKPILAVFMGGKEIGEAHRLLSKSGVPNYPFPERAIYSLEAMADYSDYLRAPPEPTLQRFEVDNEKVRQVLKSVKKDGRPSLHAVESRMMVEAYGIRTPNSIVTMDINEAKKIAKDIGYPIAMKIASPDILHKTDMGCVKLGVGSPEKVEETFNEILRNALTYFPKARIYGVEIQEMAEKGKEMIIGVTRDQQFGPLIMFGLGGIYVNFLRDVSFRLGPLTLRDALGMVEETKAYTLLRGARGEKPSDLDSLVETILRISQLVVDFEEICEMDINPLFVYEVGKSCLALDVKITISI